ncbi:DUF1990 domain-containing protein [Corynebacterium doosanense]|uniref:DUF1990 domain-containing protein n=1 Tax=Corynebacterium doosanense CAU 212 = DSM 45436 TaxID=558173 RepID=A0A097IJF0_9CORY|nr:DUF1990 domain-containing protein [Corynebacterium doosanense]AIT62282.1 hypothetical protein CDOO_07480 [Corynebacterium doosanense CAU 212 = DSM 45436]
MTTGSYWLIDAPRAVPGWAVLRESRVLGRGRADFEEAVERFRSGRAHRAAGIRLHREGEDVRMTLLGLNFHCRVAYEELSADEYVFTYVAKQQHPEEGEESFVVRIDASGTVTGFVTAISRPDLAPVRFLQRLAARRYLAGMTPAG